MSFSLGKNVTRIKESETEIYTPEDFENDLVRKNEETESNICVINLIKSKAAPVSKNTINKISTQNFLRCNLDTSKILPWYFCYQFNEGKALEQQISMFHQGTTLSVKKLTVKSIADLQIHLPPLDKQHTIGEIYRESILEHALAIKIANEIKKYTLEMIRIIEED